MESGVGVVSGIIWGDIAMPPVPTGTELGSVSIGTVNVIGSVGKVEVRFASSSEWVDMGQPVADPATQAQVTAIRGIDSGAPKLRLRYGPTVVPGTHKFAVRVWDSTDSSFDEREVSVVVYVGDRVGYQQKVDINGSAFDENDVAAWRPGLNGESLAIIRYSGPITLADRTITKPASVTGTNGAWAVICFTNSMTVKWVRWVSSLYGNLSFTPTGLQAPVAVDPKGNVYLTCWFGQSGVSVVGYDASGQATLTRSNLVAGSVILRLDSTGNWIDSVAFDEGVISCVTDSAELPVVIAANTDSGSLFVNDVLVETTAAGRSSVFVWLRPDFTVAYSEWVTPSGTGASTAAVTSMVVRSGTTSPVATYRASNVSSLSGRTGTVGLSSTRYRSYVVIQVTPEFLGLFQVYQAPSGFAISSGRYGIAATNGRVIVVGSITETSSDQQLAIGPDDILDVPARPSGQTAGFSLGFISLDELLNPLSSGLLRIHSRSLGTLAIAATGATGVVLSTGPTGLLPDNTTQLGPCVIAFDIASRTTKWAAQAKFVSQSSSQLAANVISFAIDRTGTALLGMYLDSSYNSGISVAQVQLINSDSTTSTIPNTGGLYNGSAIADPRDENLLLTLSPVGRWAQGSEDSLPPAGGYDPLGPQWTDAALTAWPIEATGDSSVSAILQVYNPDAIQSDVPDQPTETRHTVPGSINNLIVTPGNGSAALNWDPLVDAKGYRIYKFVSYTGALVASLIAEVEGSVTSYTVTGLTNDQPVKLGVSAFTTATETVVVDVWTTPTIDGTPADAPDSKWSSLTIEVQPAGGSDQWTSSGFSDVAGALTVTQDDADGSLPDLSARVTFQPSTAIYDSVGLEARAKAVTSTGRILYSPVLPLLTTYNGGGGDVLDVSGSDVQTTEDQPVDVVWSASVPVSWTLSPTTVVDDEGRTAGTLSIINGQNSASATIRFIPAPDWNGTASADVNVVAGGATGSSILSINVDAVADAPAAPVPTTVPSFPEDGYAEVVFVWTDRDLEYDPFGTWTLEFADQPTGPWNSGGLTTPKVAVANLDDEDGDTSARVRISANGNVSGSYLIYMRVRDESGDTPVVSPVAEVSGFITAVNDKPSAPTPPRMPLCQPGSTGVVGTFTSFDPDPGSGLTWQLAASASGPWSTTMTLAGIGVLSVEDPDAADLAGRVRFTPDGALVGPALYRFYLRAVDGSGLAGDGGLITGAVSSPALSVHLQRLIRTTTSASVSQLCPLTTVTSLRTTDSLDGPGSASVSVTAAELARRAEQLGITVQALLDPNAVEVVVRSGNVSLWTGPIVETAFDAGSGIVRVEARGLLTYLESREVETQAEYINVEQSALAWEVVSTEQEKDFGHLALTNGATATGVNRTIKFEKDSTVAGALDALQRQANGVELWVDPDRAFRAALARGEDKRTSIRITSGQVLSSNLAVREESIATVVIVDGKLDENDVPIATATASDPDELARRGRMVRRVRADNLQTTAACQALAEEILQASRTPTSAYRVSIDVDPYRPVAVSDIDAGDVVTLDLWDPQLGHVLEHVRVVSKTVTLDASADRLLLDLDLETARFTESGDVMGRYAKGRFTPEVIAGLYDALYAA